jgi:DNA-binding transcriptional regulator YdaS (Cro superfamily)
MEPFDHFKSLIDRYGGDTQLAKALGCTQNAVWSARRRKSVSPQMALAIERLTLGEVNRSALRPDVYPPEEYAQPIERRAS